MSDSLGRRIYNKKHFYKVTWERSDVLLAEVPWLKNEERDFCIVGYRQPTPSEARAFIGNVMYDRLFDKVKSVCEITKEEALRDFEMDDWRYQKVFGHEAVHLGKTSLVYKLQVATRRSEGTLDDGHVGAMERNRVF